ncbi:DNA repair photolyase [Paenibacillus sp. OAE614]
MNIETKEITAKTILTEVKGYLDVGFTHSLNSYSGCAFACKYCYVREMPIQKFKDVPWGTWLEVKTNAAEKLPQGDIKAAEEKQTRSYLYVIRHGSLSAY